MLAAVEKTIANVGSNTNLGIVLLLVPLAKVVAENRPALLTQNQVREYLNSVDPVEGGKVFEAIKRAKPGGLGAAKEMDVHSSDASEVELMVAMELAKDRDAIALQYVTGYQRIFEVGVPLLLSGLKVFRNLPKAIVFTHVALMARDADSLIARKCGSEIADQSRFLAAKAFTILFPEIEKEHNSAKLQQLNPGPISDSNKEQYWAAVGELDFWLRSDGHRRNPGTTADLIAAILFVAIYNGDIKPPFTNPPFTNP